MDIVAGAGISKGPSNFMAGAYVAMPIAITVEGANALTRSLISFGQVGAGCLVVGARERVAGFEGPRRQRDTCQFVFVVYDMQPGANGRRVCFPSFRLRYRG